MRELQIHLSHDMTSNRVCRVCGFLQSIVDNMEVTGQKEIYIYTSSRDEYYR